MAFTASCREAGADCDYVARGETEEELMADIARHGKEVHGFTEEQLKDPEFVKKVKSVIKSE